ncbi:MAG: glycosyltransferase family 4 protein [Alphaproteobacteria bacterium]|nr:glycosyltransferase family 4 protein [Alphaproteobacteria bacterium]
MRLPWRLQNGLSKAGLAARYALAATRSTEHREIHIHFAVGFHGWSGGSEAIADVANMLSRSCQVSFQAGPFSHFNHWLLPSVSRTSALKDADLYIVDRALEGHTLRAIKARGKPVIASIHGGPDNLHGLAAENAFTVFEYADVCQFVAGHQAEAFAAVAENRIVIPNLSSNLGKARTQAPSGRRCIGLVGNFVEPRKNLTGALEALSGTDVDSVVVWGNAPSLPHDPRVQMKGFGPDKQDIFDSFDVFLSLSLAENLPLVVLQALSAGLPCVLSDIPAHRQFADCPGVWLVGDGGQAAVAACLTAALDGKDGLAADIRAFWRAHYSPDVVECGWRRLVDSMLKSTAAISPIA